jgi:hypothetical protein
MVSENEAANEWAKEANKQAALKHEQIKRESARAELNASLDESKQETTSPQRQAAAREAVDQPTRPADQGRDQNAARAAVDEQTAKPKPDRQLEAKYAAADAWEASVARRNENTIER